MIDKKLATLLLVVFIDLVGFGLVIPLLPVMVENAGGTALTVGFAISIFSIMQFFFSPILGRLSDKYGRRPVLITTATVNALSYFMIFLLQDMWIIFLARALAGIGSANVSVAQAYIADTSASHERTKKMGLVGSVLGLGFVFGPLIGGIAASGYGINAPFLLTGILSLLSAILVFLFLPESNKEFKKNIKIEFINIRVTRELLVPKNMAFLLLLFFFVNLAMSLTIGVFPLYSESKFGWDELLNSYYFALLGASGFITQAFLLRFLLKKLTEIKILRVALLVFGTAIMSVGLVPLGILAYMTAPFMSFGFSMININTQALISLESKPEEQGIALGTAQSFGSLARVIGPIIGGLIADIHLGMPYITAGILAFIIFYFGNKQLKLMKTTHTSS